MFKLCNCGMLINLGSKRCTKCEEKQGGNSDRKEYHKWYDKNRRNKESKDFYQSKEWKQARAAVLARDNYLCVKCIERDKLNEAYAVDHIVPLRVDWSLRFAQPNLQSLCHSCHSVKTRCEQSLSRRTTRRR